METYEQEIVPVSPIIKWRYDTKEGILDWIYDAVRIFAYVVWFLVGFFSVYIIMR